MLLNTRCKPSLLHILRLSESSQKYNMAHVRFAPVAEVQSIPLMLRISAPKFLPENHEKLATKVSSSLCNIAVQDELSGLMEDLCLGKLSVGEAVRNAGIICCNGMRTILDSGDSESEIKEAFNTVDEALSNFTRDTSDQSKISAIRAVCVLLSAEKVRSDVDQLDDELQTKLEDARAELKHLELLLLEKKLRKLQKQLEEKEKRKVSAMKARLDDLQEQLRLKAMRAAAM